MEKLEYQMSYLLPFPQNQKEPGIINEKAITANTIQISKFTSVKLFYRPSIF